jgi:hypothetical protein
MLDHNKLSNKGWAQMSALLDEQMPQSKKRRYPLGWWTVASLGLLLVGIWGWWQRANNNETQVSGGQQPVNETMSVLPIPTQPQGASTYTNNTHTTDTKIEANKINLLQQQIKKPVAQGKKTPIFHPNQYYNNGLLIGKDPSIKETELNILKLVLPKLVTTPEDIVQQDNNSAAKDNITAVDQIEQKHLTIQYQQDLPTLEKLPTPLVKKKKSNAPHFSLGLMAGANALQVKQTPGLLGGFTTDITFPRKRLGLQTGLLYRYQEFSGESRPVIPVTYANYTDATGKQDLEPANLPNSWYYLAATNRVLVPVMKSHQIEIPAMFFLRLGSRYRFYSGINFLRHVWIESADKALFTYNLKVITVSDDKSRNNLNNVITSQLPKWEKNWQTGISFRPAKRVEIGLFYRSVWKGTPVLSDFNSLFDTCKTCDSKYPKARKSTMESIRPQSLQLNVSFKF